MHILHLVFNLTFSQLLRLASITRQTRILLRVRLILMMLTGTKMKRPVHPCLSNEKPRDQSARTTMCADTSTWDLSQDFEFGVDFYFGDDQVPQVADKTTVHERQKELNRTAQQRTRQKKKVREVSHFQPGELTRLSLNVACLFHAWCVLCTMIRSARQTLRLSLLRQPASCTTLG